MAKENKDSLGFQQQDELPFVKLVLTGKTGYIRHKGERTSHQSCQILIVTFYRGTLSLWEQVVYLVKRPSNAEGIFSSPCQMLICTEWFTGTLQGSQPSTEISFIPPLNCEKQFLWFKGSYMYYFFCLSQFLKTSEMVRWFWCVSPLSLHSSCAAHFLHSIWVTSHPLSCPVSWSFTLVLRIAVSLQRGFLSHRGETQGHLQTTLHWSTKLLLRQKKPCPIHTCYISFCKHQNNKHFLF